MVACCARKAGCGIFARLLLGPGSPDAALAFFRRAAPPPAGMPNGGPQALPGSHPLANGGPADGGGPDAALLAFVDLWLDRCGQLRV